MADPSPSPTPRPQPNVQAMASDLEHFAGEIRLLQNLPALREAADIMTAIQNLTTTVANMDQRMANMDQRITAQLDVQRKLILTLHYNHQARLENSMIYLRSADDTLSALYSHYTHQPIPDFPAHARDIATLPGPRAAAILREIDVNVPATTAARRTANVQSTTAYDRALVYNYWNITLLSIWTSISDGFETVFEKSLRTASALDWWGLVRTQVRRSAILVSLVLGLVNNITLMLDNQWDSETSGLCYHYNDFSSMNSQWFWIAGTWSTARTAVEVAFPKVTLALDRVDEWAARSERWLIRRTRQAWGDVSAVPMSISGVQKRGGFVQPCLSVLLTLGWAICVIFWWLLRQFLATWAVGVGTPAVTAVANSAFLVWNMEDVISTKVLNIPLGIDSGPPWGFGQVLPMVLLLAVLLTGLDAAREADVEAEEHEKKARLASSTGGESEENLILGALSSNTSADASGLQYPVPAHAARHFQPQGVQYRRSFPVRIA
ncbi:hypothetical protein LTR02_007540 [Friedmanniomyces endolithicus]|nr:hypothetical protein LTR02_007540 [Friedmanniomyces endolithicus]